MGALKDLFSSPKMPAPAAPLRMPDPQDPAAIAAAQAKERQRSLRFGNESQNLAGLNRSLGRDKLGA